MARSLLQLMLLLLIVLPGMPSFPGVQMLGKHRPNHSANTSFIDWPLDDMGRTNDSAGHPPILMSAIWDSSGDSPQSIPPPCRMFVSCPRGNTFRAYIRLHSLLI